MKIIRFTLTNGNINKYVTLIRQKGIDSKADNTMLVKTCLALEEVLLNYQSQFGSEHEIGLKYKTRFNSLIISLELPGAKTNPIDNDEQDANNVIWNSLNLSPRYSYVLGINRIVFSVEINNGKKDLYVIIAAVIIGILVGCIGSFMPDDVMQPGIMVVQGISGAILGLMQMAALPVIFLCIVSGILGSGTISSFKENGRSLLGKMLLSSLLMLLLTTVVSMLCFGVGFTATDMDSGSLKELLDTVFSIVPDNFIAPFVNGENIKVIIIGLLFGIALLTLGDRVESISRGVFQLKDACSLVMTWIGKLIPLLVAVVLVENIWNGSMGPELLSFWKLVVVYVAICFAVMLYYMLRISRKCHIPLKKVAKAVAAPGMKGFISSSSMFCLVDMTNGLQKDLGISESKVNIGIPLSFAFFQPIVVLYGVFILFFVGLSGTPVNAAWLVSFLLTCFVTSIAAPPVSGGTVTLLAILFSTLGVTGSAIAMAYPLFMLMSYLNAAFRVMTMMLEVAKD